MPTFSGDVLTQIAQTLVEGMGTPPDSARVVSSSLVEANLVGHDSHGVMRLPSYAQFLREGLINPKVQPKIKSQHQAIAQIDGQQSWGQLGARLAAQTAIELAHQFGLAAVTIDHCVHIGRVGEYVSTIAQAGMMGLAMCNHYPAVAPFGSRERVMGTNPMAWAVPRAAGFEPVVVDFATAAVAEGKLRVARAKGEMVAPGLIIDREGRPSQNPLDFYNGGALLPFGGHKGYGLSLMVELLGGALSGAAPSILPEFEGSNGTLMIALNISAFMPLEQYIAQVETFCAKIKAAAPAEGFSEVLLPGEPESRSRQQRLTEGIPIPEKTWQEFCTLAGELKVILPE
jgi:uncharacterized oxidoreductase